MEASVTELIKKLEEAHGAAKRVEAMHESMIAIIGEKPADLLVHWLSTEKILNVMESNILKQASPMAEVLMRASLVGFEERRMQGFIEQMRFRLDQGGVPNEKRLEALPIITSVVMDMDPVECKKQIDEANGEYGDFQLLFRPS